MNLKTNQKGFTIVELLIVIVVIAILAAISIVAFTGIQQRGRDSARASDASNIVKALTAYTTDDSTSGGGSWPASASDARSSLTGYTAANLSADIISKIQLSADPGSDTPERDQYRYEQCTTGTPGTPSGARITYYSEQDGAPRTVSAGVC